MINTIKLNQVPTRPTCCVNVATSPSSSHSAVQATSDTQNVSYHGITSDDTNESSLAERYYQTLEHAEAPLADGHNFQPIETTETDNENTSTESASYLQPVARDNEQYVAGHGLENSGSVIDSTSNESYGRPFDVVPLTIAS